MILRRVAQNLKQQHWTGVFIELLIVVFGVFIGMQASNWNESRHDRGLEKQYLRRLRDDMQLSIRIANTHIAGMQSQFQLEGGMLSDLASCRLDGKEARSRFSLGIYFIGRIEPPALVSGTIDELRSTGRIGLLRDVALRTKLAEIVQTTNLENGVLRMIVARATPQISYIDSRVVLKQPPGGFQSKSIFKHGMPLGSVEYDFPDLCKDPHFAPAISTIQELTNVLINVQHGDLVRYEALLKSINHDLGETK